MSPIDVFLIILVAAVLMKWTANLYWGSTLDLLRIQTLLLEKKLKGEPISKRILEQISILYWEKAFSFLPLIFGTIILGVYFLIQTNNLRWVIPFSLILLYFIYRSIDTRNEMKKYLKSIYK